MCIPMCISALLTGTKMTKVPWERFLRNQLLRLWDTPGKNTGVDCHFLLQCMRVKSESEVAQSCPTLSNPMDHSLPGSSIHGIFQARVLEWGAIAFSLINSITCYSLDSQNLFILYLINISPHKHTPSTPGNYSSTL